jgi:hypothetical protein
MVIGTIFRKVSDKEKKDWDYVIGEKTIKDEFRENLIKTEKECNSKRIPFCRACAIIDFERSLENIQREAGHNRDSGAFKKAVEQIEIKNYDKYMDSSRFELLNETEAKEPKLLDGMKMKVSVGMWLNFQCKERGCRISVFMPSEEYNKRKKRQE